MNLDASTLLCEGRNSLIYYQESTQYESAVVIKVLKAKYPSVEQIAQFNNEYELTKDLQIDGLRRAYDRTKLGDQYSIVLQYFKGETLSQVFGEGRRSRDSGERSLEDVLRVAIAIARTLGEIHQNQIIHKDINSHNILVDVASHNIKIIDFGISSKIRLKSHHLGYPTTLEGNLAYISPEQTGRMNRTVDHSTDLYSLGVTLYEMLAGRLPFDSRDPVQLIYCHIAKKPTPLSHIDPRIPPALSDIVDKLLAKTPEDRYLSAFGLQADLEKCLDQLRETGQVLRFPLGREDFSTRFQIFPKLYGREREIGTLLQTFARISQGNPVELMLVQGYSGVGKTSLVNEAHKPLVEKRGYFVSGKYSQFHRDIPYSALVQAFTSFVDQLLTESAERLAWWKERIVGAAGSNAQVLIEFIPALELVIGKQPPVPELETASAHNRFNDVFRDFLRAICQPTHPLVLFIDDLQWADLASLTLLSSVLTDAENRCLLIIGAFRDNEVDADHPLQTMLNKASQNGAVIQQIQLSNLTGEHVGALIADTLHCSQTGCDELASLVHDKTHGNAFFTNQFLISLHEDELLRFDFEARRWTWNVEQIRARNIADNVVELMANKVRKLPPATQAVLQHAACIGNQFSLRDLSLVDHRQQSETLGMLWAAIKEGLVLPLDDNYRWVSITEERQEHVQDSRFRFAHDRIEQACYSLIPAEARGPYHLKIGRAMRETLRAGEDVAIFNVVNQLNRSIDLIDDPGERLDLAELNFAASSKAKTSTAFSPACVYLRIGTSLLPEDAWDTHYEFTRDMYMQLIELEYMTGDFSESKRLADLSLAKVRSDIEKARIYDRLILQYMLEARYTECLAMLANALNCLDGFPDRAEMNQLIERDRREIADALRERSIASIADEPDITDPKYMVTMSVLANGLGPAYLSDPELLVWMGTRAVVITLRHGLSSATPHGLILYATLLSTLWGEYPKAYEFGELAIELAAKAGPSQLARVSHMFASNVMAWVRPIRETYAVYDQGFQAGIESGEWQYSGYLRYYRLSMPYYQGELLKDIHSEIPRALQFAVKTQNRLTVDCVSGFQLLVSNLMGLTDSRSSFDLEEMTEEDYLRGSIERKSWYALCPYYVIKSEILYIYGQYDEALQCTVEAEKFIPCITGKVPIAKHTFQRSLILLALCRDATPETREEHLVQVAQDQEQMKIWADHCEANFGHQYLFVEAERVRLTGGDPTDLYDETISMASKYGQLRAEAMANARAGSYWHERDKEEISQIYLRRARHLFGLWGAKRVVEHLDATYGRALLDTLSAPLETRTGTTTAFGTGTSNWTSLDVLSAMNAVRTLSQELSLDALLDKMLETLNVITGADRSAVILDEDDELVVRALRDEQRDQCTVLTALPVEQCSAVPRSVINYVKRRQMPLASNDVQNDETSASDPCIVEYRPRSVLCFPVIAQSGDLRCILYFENRLSTEAFTPERVELLEMLSAQVAICLRNADVHARLMAQVDGRTRQVEDARSRIVELEGVVTEHRMAGGFAHEMRNALSAAKMALAVALDDENPILTHMHEHVAAVIAEMEPTIAADHRASLDRCHERIKRNSDKLQRALTMAQRATVRAMTVTNQILDYSRLGYAHVGTEPVSVNTVISRIVDESRADLDSAGIVVRCELCSDDAVVADEPHLYSIFKNIIDNAREAFAEAGNDSQRTIEIVTERSSEALVAKIRDNGIGISKADQAKLFEPFFTRKPTTGTGMGLNFVYKLLSLYRGTIELDSTPGQGTTFNVTLPRSQDAAAMRTPTLQVSER